MNKKFFLYLIISSLLYSETSLKFLGEKDSYENQYGEKVSIQSVSVETKDYKINRFWYKFNEDKNSQDLDVNLKTLMDFRAITRETFLCDKYNLDQEGCSGQKPLFINKGTLDNPQLQVDANGDALPQDEYRIPFDSAKNYSSGNNDAFYALDIPRDMEYYKPQLTLSKDNKKNFFQKIIAFFKDYFSQDTSVYSNGIENPDERQRYMANLFFGAQLSHRIKKQDSINTSIINGATNANTISLLDYNSQTIITKNGCKGLLLNYDPDSLSCKTLRFFGVSKWMPFVKDNKDKIVNVNTTSVLEDTETTLLTLAGNLNNKDYVSIMKNKIEGIDNTSDSSFLQELFKPMINMMGGMYRFFFGSRSKVTTKKIYLDFKFDKPLPITFSVVDNGIVSGFEHFLLKGIESVYGTEVTECKVYKSHSGPFIGTAFDMIVGVDKYTIRQNLPLDNDLKEFYLGETHKVISDDRGVREHNLLNQRRVEKKVCVPLLGCKGTGEYKVWAQLSTQDWLNWCQRNQHDGGKKGLFGRFISAIKDLFSRPSTYEEQIDHLLASEKFYVGEYKEKVHKGLILHLKNIKIDQIGVGTPGTQTIYEVKDISQSGLAKPKHHKK